MPFNVLNLATGELALDNGAIASFSSSSMAIAWANDLIRLTGQKHQIRVEISDDWKAREKARFYSGEYMPVAWQYATFWNDKSEALAEHYCHRSKDKPSFIAFTENAEKGSRDIQTRMRPGAYLTKYFSDVLSESQINHYARLHAMLSGDQVFSVQFAKTAREIIDVYVNGPESCMTHDASEYSSHIHPVSVYGDSDLQLAYIEAQAEYHDADIMARALVWPERKIYGRVYPTPERYVGGNRDSASAAYQAMVQALESLGYSPGRFNGAKIRKIESQNSNGDYVMPYLDGAQDVDDDGDSWIIKNDGEYSATETNGTLELGGNLCECCETRIRRDDDYTIVQNRRNHGMMYCESCASDNAFYCNGYGEYFSDDQDSVIVDHETYSLRYAENNFSFCERSEEWTRESTATVNVRSGTQEWADLDETFYCDGTSEYYSCDDYESVEIDGETYEAGYAQKNGLVNAETETETA
jgi:hypothetical protein